MDIGKSIGYVFEDEGWLGKVLIGGLIGLVPIVNLAAGGYALQALRNVAEGQERPLPTWDRFGDFFVQGLMLFIGTLLYSLPALAVNLSLPFLEALSRARYLGDLVAMAAMMLGCLAALYLFVVGLWLPAAIANYALAGDLGAFFRFGQIWELISRRLGDYAIVLVAAWVASLVAGVVGLALCGIGLAFTSFVSTLIGAHLLGQLLGAARQTAEVEA